MIAWRFGASWGAATGVVAALSVATLTQLQLGQYSAALWFGMSVRVFLFAIISYFVAKASQAVALAKEVDLLRGLLRICSYCKNIKDEGDLWTSVETYIAARADVDFTHGICPTCAQKLREELKDTLSASK